VQQILLSLLLGSVTGFLFAIFSLPVPAPANLAGVLGIVGLFAGYLLGKYLKMRVF
jgi:XapX domain-containing protein